MPEGVARCRNGDDSSDDSSDYNMLFETYFNFARRQANKGTSPDMWTRAWVSRYWPSDPIPLFLFRFSISFIFQKNTLLFVSFTFLYSSNITKTAKITNRELNKKKYDS